MLRGFYVACSVGRSFGALTNKPAAFQGRAWEFESVRTFNPLDALHRPVQVDFRGTSLLRVLPVVEDRVMGGWLEDRVRFGLDSLTYQRQSNITVQIPGEGELEESDRFRIAAFILFLAFATLRSSMGAVGVRTRVSFPTWFRTPLIHTDLSEEMAATALHRQLGGGFPSLPSSNIPVPSPVFFSNNTSFLFTPLPSVIVLLGVELRFKLPHLYLQLQRTVSSDLLFFTVGTRGAGLGRRCPTVSLGSTWLAWLQVLTGQHSACGLLTKRILSTGLLLGGLEFRSWLYRTPGVRALFTRFCSVFTAFTYWDLCVTSQELVGAVLSVRFLRAPFNTTEAPRTCGLQWAGENNSSISLIGRQWGIAATSWGGAAWSASWPLRLPVPSTWERTRTLLTHTGAVVRTPSLPTLASTLPSLAATWRMVHESVASLSPTLDCPSVLSTLWSVPEMQYTMPPSRAALRLTETPVTTSQVWLSSSVLTPYGGVSNSAFSLNLRLAEIARQRTLSSVREFFHTAPFTSIGQ